MNDVILDLKILSKLTNGAKLRVDDDKKLSIDNSYIRSLTRLYYKDNRENTVNYIYSLKDKTESLLNSSKDSNDSTSLLVLNNHIEGALRGISALMVTYSGDDYTISRLELLNDAFLAQTKQITDIVKCV